ncbi:MAG: hypothetical protein ACYTEQ_27105 [Planctomycetota bacterium]|jgi:hypothetical protein
MDPRTTLEDYLTSLNTLEHTIENTIENMSTRLKTLGNQTRLLDKFVARMITETSRLEASCTEKTKIKNLHVLIDSLNRRIEHLENKDV